MSPVEAYIRNLPDRNTRQLMQQVRGLVLAAAPGVEEKISYTVPFFTYFGNFCYLSPARTGMYIGFTKGHQLSNVQGLLVQGERKIVRVVSFETEKELQARLPLLREVVQEAILLQELGLQKSHKHRS